jgi:peptidoglycan/LPS O-acetylase OafA/YrhL
VLRYDFPLGFAVSGVAVAAFFVVSGYFVTQSWLAEPSARRFALKRFFRIWPALIVVVGVLVVILGPALTSVSIHDYFTSPTTRDYLLHNISLHKIKYDLPGVFTSFPDPAVNGSLWTLPYEVFAYICVLAAGVLGLMRRRAVILAAYVGALGLYELDVRGHTIERDVFGLQARFIIVWGAFFAAGAVLLLYRDVVRPSWRGVGLAVAALVVSIPLNLPVVAFVALPYMFVFLATRRSAAARTLRKAGDPSYGVYIWAFPVQQTLIYLGWHHDSWELLFVEASVISVALGYLSWHVVEHPALRFVHRKRTAAPVATPSG